MLNLCLGKAYIVASMKIKHFNRNCVFEKSMKGCFLEFDQLKVTGCIPDSFLYQSQFYLLRYCPDASFLLPLSFHCNGGDSCHFRGLRPVSEVGTWCLQHLIGLPQVHGKSLLQKKVHVKFFGHKYTYILIIFLNFFFR